MMQKAMCRKLWDLELTLLKLTNFRTAVILITTLWKCNRESSVEIIGLTEKVITNF